MERRAREKLSRRRDSDVREHGRVMDERELKEGVTPEGGRRAERGREGGRMERGDGGSEGKVKDDVKEEEGG